MATKKSFKALVVGLGIVSIFSSALPMVSHSVFADSALTRVDKANDIVLNVDGNKFYNVSVSEDIVNAGQILEDYFYVDKFGNINLKGTPEEIAKNIGISVQEASLMYEAVKELPNVYERGPVGFRFNLGPQVRGMGGWAAGAFATGYAGWHLKQFAVNPVTAGFVAVISGAIGWAVKTAVENYWTVAVATVEVPFVNLVYTIDLP